MPNTPGPNGSLFVQTVRTNYTSAPGTSNLTYGNTGVATKPGNVIVVLAAFTTSTGMSVTDDAGNTYTQISIQTANTPRNGIWVAFNAKRLAASTNVTLTATGGNPGEVSVAIYEYSGVIGAAVFDAKATQASAASTTWDSAATPLSAGNDLWVGLVATNGPTGDTMTVTSPYTARDKVGGSSGTCLLQTADNLPTTAVDSRFQGTISVSRTRAAATVALITAPTPYVVQSLGGNGLVGSESSQLLSPAKATTLGNVIVVGVTMNRASAQVVSSVTDTAGNTYARIDRGAGSLGCELWFAPITTAWTTSDSLTVNFSAAVTLVEVTAQEWANVDTIVTWDSATEATGTGTGPSSGSTTARYPSGVVISATAAGATVTFSALAAGYTEDFSGGVAGAQLEMAHHIYTDKTSQSFSCTISASNPWSNLIATLIAKTNIIARQPSTNQTNAILGSAQGTATNPATTAITTALATKAGSLIIVSTGTRGTGPNPSVTDSAGNTYVQWMNYTDANGTCLGALLYCLNAKVIAASGTITVTWNGNSTAQAAFAYEISNATVLDPDESGSHSFSGGTASTAITSLAFGNSAHVNDVLVGLMVTDGPNTDTITAIPAAWFVNPSQLGNASIEVYGGIDFQSAALNTNTSFTGTDSTARHWAAGAAGFALAFTPALTEAVGIVSDTGTLNGKLSSRIATEAIGFVSDTTRTGFGITVPEALNWVSDAATRFTARFPTATDAVSFISESVSRVYTQVRTVAEALGFGGDVATLSGFGGHSRTATDAIAYGGDVAVRGAMFLPRFMFDTFAGSDVATRVATHPRTVTDAVAYVSETATRTFAMPRPVAEAIGYVSDAAVRSAYLRTRTATDAVGIVSDLAFKGLPKLVTEAVPFVSDTATRAAMVFSRVKTEAIGIVSDLASKGAQILSRPVLESTDYSDNFEIAPHTDVVFKSFGTDATGTLNAWTGTGSIAGNVVTFTANQVLAGGHPDWDDITLTGRFLFSTNSTPSFSMRNDGAGNSVYGLVDGVNVRIGQITNNNFQAPEITAAVPLVAGTQYWFKASVIGNVFTVQVFADNAGAISATQIGSTATKTDVRSPRGKISVGCPFGGGSAGTTWGGAFASVLKVEGNIPGGGWSFGPGGAGWASSEPAFALSSALAYTASLSASVNAPAAIAGSGYWFNNITTLPNKTYVLRCLVNAPASGTGNFSVTTYNNGNTIIGNVDLVYPTAGWVLVTYAFVTPADNTFSQVVLRVNSGGQGYFGLLQILPQQDTATRPFWNWLKTAGANFVLDPSFEVGNLALNWTATGTYTLDTSAGNSKVGPTAALCTRTVTTAGSWDACISRVRIPVQVGASYYWSLWSKQNAGAKQSHFKVQFYDSAGGFLSAPQIMGGTDGLKPWTQYSATIVAPASAATCEAVCMAGWWDGLSGTNAQTWYDGIQMGLGNAPDEMYFTDLASRGIGRFAVDAFAYISDSALFTRLSNRVVTEAAPYIADLTARLLALTRTNTDALPLQGDVAARSAQLVVRSALDALGFVADSALRAAYLRTRTGTDAAPYVSDTGTRTLLFPRLIAEAIGLVSDQANLNKVFAKFVTEPVAFISDTASRTLALIPRAATDALGYVGDVAAKISRLRYTASDTIPFITDVAPRLYTTPRTATDAVPYGGDANASNRIYVRTAADTLGFVSETATFTAIKVKIGVLLIRSMVKGLVIRGRSR